MSDQQGTENSNEGKPVDETAIPSAPEAPAEAPVPPQEPAAPAPTLEAPVAAHQNVEVSAACKTPLKEGQAKKLISDDYLDILQVSLPQFNYAVAQYPNMNVAKGAHGQMWANSLQASIQHHVIGGTFDTSLTREDSMWGQVVEHEGDRICAGRPSFGGADSGPLTGERAIIKTTALMGLGALVQVPLWHTGIWISFKAPSDASLLELERRIAEEKVNLGRQTNGMVFSNSTVFLMSYLLNFAFKHVYDCSLPDLRLEALKAKIKITDIPSIVWGLACTIYPNGYPLAQPCVDNPEKCQHVAHELLALNKLLFVDNKALTTFQRKLMTKRRNRFSDEELERYQQEHTRGGERICKINDVVSLRLNVPTIQQYENSGFSWIEGIETMMVESFSQNLRGDERNEYMFEQSQVTKLRQYSHWIDRVLVSSGEDKVETIEDRETIEELMGRMSANQDFATSCLEEISKYIDDSTVALIAIPMYNCPECGASQVPKDSPNPYLIPLDMARIFFTLQRQRLSKALR